MKLFAIVVRIALALLWAVCLYNLFAPLAHPLDKLLYLVLGVTLIMHLAQALIFGSMLKLGWRGKLDIFLFGALAAARHKQALAARQQA
ncbi:DUF1145 domain-containing protein [Gallaecimonas sp. GXIMD4217]|uniref:DUF1145 domain-containing protein n=1 Tax=Gallaecimonas sp. GXIMD4217 TaxID=3131927 RepID=UPI00311B19CE